MTKILVALSHHGFGHIAQTAAVLGQLKLLRPQLQLTIVSAAPPAALQGIIGQPFEHVPMAVDSGMQMHDALRVDAVASHASYRTFHRQWRQHLDSAMRIIDNQMPQLVLSNISYLFVTAAAACKVPAQALCSLNWHDVYQTYCHSYTGANEILTLMRNGYRQAEIFIRPEPSMPMPWLDNRRSVGPVARLGKPQSEHLRHVMAIPPDKKLVLLALGGVPMNLNLAHWPAFDDVMLITEAALSVDPRRHRDWQQAGLSFIDLLASVDGVITKSGYGTFTEAACNGKPVIHVSRPDWPEEPYLVPWLQANTHSREISADQLATGSFYPALSELLHLPAPKALAADGAREAAILIANRVS